jgi:hypothetical protein
MSFTCEICNFKTNLSANYNQHLATKKHIRLCKLGQPFVNPSQPFVNPSQPFVNPSQPFVNPNDKLICKYCDKTFSHKQSLSKHIKYACKKNKDEDLHELVRLLNLQLEQQRSETEKQRTEAELYKADSKKQLENQQKQIDKLMDKLQVPQVTNNIQNNNIRLSYKDTDVSHLTDADYRKSVNSLLMCVKTFIGIVHLDPDHPENMNIYISNLKDKYIMVYTGETWELKNRNYEMANLYDDNEMLLSEWVEEHGNHDLQNKFKTYLERKENSLEMIHEEIRLMLYNKRHMALCE